MKLRSRGPAKAVNNTNNTSGSNDEPCSDNEAEAPSPADQNQMQLRKRAPAKAKKRSSTASDSDFDAGSESEPESESSNSSDDEDFEQSAPASVKRPARVAPARGKHPELLELALQHLDVREVLPRDSLRALRLTSKRIREVVENAGALARFFFSGRGLHYFNVFLETPRSIKRAEAIEIHGSLFISQATKFILCEFVHSPKLNKLVLEKTSDGTEAMLCGQFPNLTSLKINNSMKGNGFNLLADAKWPLRELTLENCRPSKDNLADILDNFPHLTKLRLASVKISAIVSVKRFEQGLDELEILEIEGAHSTHIQHHLFHENLKFPAIKTLVYEAPINSLEHSIFNCSWITQLKSLTVANYDTRLPSETFEALMGVLAEAPELECFSLYLAGGSRSNWGSVSLPNATKLHISLKLSDRPEGFNFCSWLSSMHVPKLKEASFSSSTSSFHGVSCLSSVGIENMTSAFPHLRLLSLFFSSYDITVSPTVVGEIFSNFLPQLEDFKLTCTKHHDDDIGANLFGAEYEEGEGVKWPLLRKLELSMTTRNQLRQRIDQYPVAVLEQLAAAAQHCPSLSSLKVNANVNSMEETEKIATVLKEASAWPLMKYFAVKGYFWRSRLNTLWPNADFPRVR